MNTVIRQSSFLFSFVAANIVFIALLGSAPMRMTVQFLNALVVSVTLLLAAGYWNFLVNVVREKHWTRTYLFGLSIIGMWIGIVAFRLYSTINVVNDVVVIDSDVRSKILVFGQFNVVFAAALQLYAAKMYNDYADRPVVRGVLYGAAIFVFVGLMTAQGLF